MLAILGASNPADYRHPVTPTAVYRAKEGESIRELRLWTVSRGSYRFEVSQMKAGDNWKSLLQGKVKPLPPGDSECDSYPGQATGKCWEVRQYQGHGDAYNCWVMIRLEIANQDRASVRVWDCNDSARLDSQAIYEKVK